MYFCSTFNVETYTLEPRLKFLIAFFHILGVGGPISIICRCLIEAVCIVYIKGGAIGNAKLPKCYGTDKLLRSCDTCEQGGVNLNTITLNKENVN